MKTEAVQSETPSVPQAGLWGWPPPFVFEVKSYRKRLTIGCAEDEQSGGPQEVVFDLDVHIKPMANLLRDVWNPGFDYCTITAAVDRACDSAGVKILQEPLAFEVVRLLFQGSDLVQRVQVLIRKTERYEGCDWIGFRLDLERDQWLRLEHELAHPNN